MHRAGSPEEAVQLLADLGEDSKLLAGGQSLVPMMNFRLARPSALVDINGLRDLDHVTHSSEGLRIGALTRHITLEDPTRFPAQWGIVSRVARWIGHYPIRTRGTFGGSIAHADPSAELPVLSLVFDATFDMLGPRGARTIPSSEFFKGPFQVDMEMDEMLSGALLKEPPPEARFSVHEFARRAGDFAIVLVIAGVALENGRCTWARIGLGGVGGVPRRAVDAERTLLDATLSEETIEAAAVLASEGVTPLEDIHASADHRRHLVKVLVRRAVADAAGDRT